MNFSRGTSGNGKIADVRYVDLHKGQSLELAARLALSAASISAEVKLPMADSLILAMARTHQVVLWTQDEHFKNVPSVKYIAKR